MNKRKLLAPFLMLFAGAIAAILLAVGKYELKTYLSILLFVLIVFYLMGAIIAMMLDHFEKQNEISSLDEGEVIEKQPEETEQNTGA